ncbi:MAG: sodium/proline symporter [Polyangia bacterium]|jgi:SSS family solute:Na+ symporter|nr:sodium/proline symporter [Polyangia bacterium]
MFTRGLTLSASSQDPFAILTFCLYLSLIISVGLLARTFASRGISEFFLGGRRLGAFVVATSAVVSGRSAWLLLGFTGLAYSIGAAAVWAVVGYILVELWLFAFVGRRLRRLTGEAGDLTIPDFLSSRAGGSRAVRATAAVIILFFMVVYVASQVRAGGEALAASFLPASAGPGGPAKLLGMDVVGFGAVITSIIILGYTITGGYAAVVINDAIQAVLILGSLVLLPVVAALRFPGSVTDTLALLSPNMVDPVALSAGAAIGFVGIGLGSPGNPHILVRYMSARDERVLTRAAFYGTFWNVVMAWGALWIGLLGRAYFPGSLDLPGGRAEAVYPTLAQAQLPGWLFGLVLASIFAAILSTADSQLLVGASTVVRDIGQRLLGSSRESDDARLVRASRWVVFVLLALATILGLVWRDLVFTLVLFAWGGLGASLGPPVLLALYFRRTTGKGMLAGMIGGAIVTVVWRLVPACQSLIMELVPAFATSTLLTVLVSLWSDRSSSDARES